MKLVTHVATVQWKSHTVHERIQPFLTAWPVGMSWILRLETRIQGKSTFWWKKGPFWRFFMIFCTLRVELAGSFRGRATLSIPRYLSSGSRVWPWARRKNISHHLIKVISRTRLKRWCVPETFFVSFFDYLGIYRVLVTTWPNKRFTWFNLWV